MTDNVNVEIGGKSKYEVAYNMAEYIFALEGKGPTREQFLKTVYDCIVSGVSPTPCLA